MSKSILTVLPAAVFTALFPVVAVAQTAKTFPAASLKSINVETGSGDITVQKVPGSNVMVSVTNDDPSKCDITMDVQGSVLTLKAKGASSGFMSWFLTLSSCRAGFTVQTPVGLTLDASSGSGDVAVTGLGAGVTVNTGSGDISFDHVAGDLTARAGSGSVKGQASSNDVTVRTGSGDISLTGLLGSADIKAGSGSVALQWVKAPKAGSVNVKTGSGDMTLTFPQGTKLQTSILSGSGKTFNEIGDTAGAAFGVSVMSGSGDVSIKKSAG